MSVGIGITTYNRPYLLAYTLVQVCQYSAGATIVVVNDGDPQADPPPDGVTWIQHPQRQGVAAAKNTCLRALRDQDIIILLDDDTFPIRHDWIDHLHDAMRQTSVQHLLYYPELTDRHDRGDTVVRRRSCGTYDVVSRSGIVSGCMLVLTREVVQRVGGFGPYPGWWGFEHAGYSARISRAGYCGRFTPYAYVSDIEQYVWAIDWLGIPPDMPEGVWRSSVADAEGVWRSSVADAEKRQSIAQNRPIWKREMYGPIYVPLEA